MRQGCPLKAADVHQCLVHDSIRTYRLIFRESHVMLPGRFTALESGFVALSVALDRGAQSGSTSRTRILFVGLCAYVLSQGVTIPILPVGPPWAMWPLLSDAAPAFEGIYHSLS